MRYTDQNLTCLDCGKTFVFAAKDQDFFARKGFTTPPKRCKTCRDLKRGQKPRDENDDLYRAPGFGGGQANGNRRGGRGNQPGRGEYRAPGFRGASNGAADYRAPGFRDRVENPEANEYRAPGLKPANAFEGADEYRAPGFRDRVEDPEVNEYRAPGYRDRGQLWKDEKPTFQAVCTACGEKTMVPFLPEEREEIFCEPCLVKRREEARQSRLAAEAAEAAARAATEVSPSDPAPATEDPAV